MSAVMRTLRIRCENTAQGVPLTGIIEVHARIGLQVGLGKAEFHTVVGSHDQWQESQSRRIELLNWLPKGTISVPSQSRT